MSYSLEELGGIHLHCFRCYSSVLCAHDGDACVFVQCELRCGAVYHACKASEHAELCERERVACINASNGCAATVLRRDRAKHLLQCPASVVVCSAEWNRWPIFSSHKLTSVPFRQRNPYTSGGQLDYELALRDERMLNSLGKVSRRTKLSLRNSLTRRFPAVPIVKEAVDREPDEVDKAIGRGLLPQEAAVMRETGEEYINLGIRKQSQISKQMAEWQKDLEERLNKITEERPPSYWEFPELEKGNIHKHCAYCYMIDCDNEDYFEDYTNRSCKIMECRWKCGVRFHSCKSFEHLMICPTYEEEDESAWMFRGFDADRLKQSGCGQQPGRKEKRRPLRTFPDLLSPATEPQASNRRLRLCGGGGGGAVIDKQQLLIHGAVPAPPPMATNIQRGCRLDIRLETVTRLQTKPQAMYTFVCAQEFRRSEYSWHCQNIHNDVHGGLNNWLEHRCPLATYGCMFSVRRMFPHSVRTTLTYSPAVESFGIAANPDYLKPQTSATAAAAPTNSAPASVTGAHASTTTAPASVTGAPASTTGAPASVTSAPASASRTGAPAPATGAPAPATGAPASASRTGAPASVTAPASASRTGAPASVTGAKAKPAESRKTAVAKKSKLTRSRSLTLCDLPLELLQDIFMTLDSFSLCNLAVTSRYLRDVCCSLLDYKGCVSLLWVRKRENNQYTWSVGCKRWFFSTAIDPILKWEFAAKEAVANHMQSCLFNQRTEHRAKPKPGTLQYKQGQQVFQQLMGRLKSKRESEWFIQ